jgi:3-dehydroshikimate dehydratase
MSLLIPGLLSITFRQHSPREIIDLAVKGGVRTMEWGGDVHVPPGDLSVAREVRRASEEAGLGCAAYGSYYRLGAGAAFEPVLESALALGAPAIRVWPGTKGSAETSPAERQAVLDDARRIAALAAAERVAISFEYHGGTLTDDRASVAKLLAELPGPEVDFLWQPTNGAPVDDCVGRLRDILPRLRHVHVFHWWPEPKDRLPLADGEGPWKQYLAVVCEPKIPTPCLLEFVRNDSPEQFLEDASTLRRWIEETAGNAAA